MCSNVSTVSCSTPKHYGVCIMVAGVLNFLDYSATPARVSNYRTTDKGSATRFSHADALSAVRYLGNAYDIIRLDPYTEA